ncbi:uncharacterized protein LOC125524154 [Triticum urartu]|uniref:uncharacterized protein LOC125524154 n=1 Tax=Triticum urartu TaxID=4572 RepID=UPI0020434AB8|nr:uncharacterized protein LOC125524154 [Triticum urartu]
MEKHEELKLGFRVLHLVLKSSPNKSHTWPSSAELPEQMVGFGSLAPKTKNLVVGGGLTGFVFGVYYYTMRAVGSTDELQVAIDKFEDLKKKDADATPAANPSTPGSS